MDSACFRSFSICLFLLLLKCATATATQKICCPIDSLYQLGDSLSDTGNKILVTPAIAAGHPPYGITSPGRPTGRWSNGLLIIDFIATALHLPLLNPYLKKNASFKNGVNFVVAGSTALDFPFFTARGVQVPPTTSPLSVQLNWFRTYLGTICSNPTECATRLRRALVFVGEIGANDINYSYTQGKTLQEIRTYVPRIIDTVINATREVIRLGATQIVVPGDIPFGCLPVGLTYFTSSGPQTFDELGCISSLNDLVTFQNNYLQNSLDFLRKEFPNVVIVYVDYYMAFRSILRRAPSLGFDRRMLLKACCGIGGQYDFNASRSCGSPGVPVCPNPKQYISWDGIHFTQEDYRRVSEIIIPDILSKIKCF